MTPIENNMKLTAVNVGYGEAMLLECPAPSARDGVYTLLIDGGGNEPGEFSDRSSGRIPLTDWLEKRGTAHIDLMISTHTHEDHICGLLAAGKRLPPRELWQTLPPGKYRALPSLAAGGELTPSQDKFLRALNDYVSLCRLTEEGGGRVCQVSGGFAADVCPGLRVDVLAPGPARTVELERAIEGLYALRDSPDFLKALSALDARMNNFSLILRLTWQGTRLLLPGDTNLLGYGEIFPGALKADFFKVGHHGQKDAVNAELMDRIRPETVLCCASSDRRYESAWPETMAMMRRKGASLWFSDCPAVEGCLIPPHEAVEFTVGGGTVSAHYL